MAAVSVFHNELAELGKEFTECKRQDTSKNELIEKLFKHIDGLGERLKDTEVELKRAKDLEGLYSEQATEANKELKELRRDIKGNSFVSILIDGDGMLFKDELVKRGLDGGRETAHMLRRVAEEYLKSKTPGLDSKAKVLIRVYANRRGVEKAYSDAKILPDLNCLEQFIQGFNKADPLCDYVDAATGKECSDEKLKANFGMHIADLHCQHVIFGGSTDNGYARLLGPYSMDERLSKRITMLEGPPFARELAELTDKFATISFESVFRTAKLSTQRVSFNITPPESPAPNYANVAVQGLLQGTNSTPAAAPGRFSKENRTPSIKRNARGQRVDSKLQFTQSDVNSLKVRKLCNPYHLLGGCPYSNCTHLHGQALNHRMLEALRHISRMSPCAHGLECNDVHCIYGHQCYRKPCTIAGCRFRPEMHGVDTNVV